MVQFALYGAGRIGRMHADNIAANPRARLCSVFDVNGDAAREVCEKHGAMQAHDVGEPLADESVDAVLIASSTDTHVDIITAAVAAGKAVLCEKPIDLDLDRVEQCARALASNDNAFVHIGFNRRHDPGHAEIHRALNAGEIGTLEQLIISSRDPEPPPLEYLQRSGGLFCDMMIHDFDLARFITGEEPVSIMAMGSAIVDPNARAINDIDTAMVVMQMESGALCHINCSRRAVYGYDQRVEAFGSQGMLLSNNKTATNVERFVADRTAAREPLLRFFIERYSESYDDELNAFINAVTNKTPPVTSFEDGRRALIIAKTAHEALTSGRSVALEF